jgi:hypothetical protein
VQAHGHVHVEAVAAKSVQDANTQYVAELLAANSQDQSRVDPIALYAHYDFYKTFDRIQDPPILPIQAVRAIVWVDPMLLFYSHDLYNTLDPKIRLCAQSIQEANLDLQKQTVGVAAVEGVVSRLVATGVVDGETVVGSLVDVRELHKDLRGEAGWHIEK